jgi:hypothetical protein
LRVIAPFTYPGTPLLVHDIPAGPVVVVWRSNKPLVAMNTHTTSSPFWIFNDQGN